MKRKLESKQDTAKRVRLAVRALRRRRAPPRLNIGYKPSGQPDEVKAADITFTTGTLFPPLATTTGVVTLLNGVSTGDDFNNRDGRKIKMLSLTIRGETNVQTGTTGSPAENFRVAVIYDRQSNGAVSTSAQIYVPDTLNGHINLNNRARYQVLMDESFTLGNVGQAALVNAGGSPCFKYHKHRINLKGLETVYQGTTAAATDIASGTLYFVAYRTTGFATVALGGNWTFRLRFQG